MKILSLLIVIFFSINSQAFLKGLFGLDDSNASKEVKDLKEKLSEKKKLYKELEELKNIEDPSESVGTKVKPLVVGIYEKRSGKHGRSAQLAYFFGLAGIPVLAHMVESEFNKIDLDEYKIKGIRNKFLSWVKKSPLTIGILIFIIATDRLVVHSGTKRADEFTVLYEKYQDTTEVLTDEKKKEILESLKDPKQFDELMTKNFKNYVKELKRLQTFSKLLKESISKDEQKLEKLEKLEEL